jgi:hypothetical protein
MTEGSEERDLDVVEEGWYPDPDDSRGRWLRYWDGEDWSDTPAKLASATEREQMTWPAASDDMQAFEALSYGDKWRVRRFLARGEAPSNPQMAAAAVELGKSYRGRDRNNFTLMRWGPTIFAVGFGAATISAVAKGDALTAILDALIVLGWVGHLMFNPMCRPRSVARSLEASRRVVASGTQNST